MSQAKVTGELSGLGADLTSTNMNEGHIAHSKSKASSVMHESEENNVLCLQTINSDNNEEALAGATTALSLLLLLLTIQQTRILARAQ